MNFGKHNCYTVTVSKKFNFMLISSVSKMSDNLKNQLKKEEGDRNVRFVALCKGNQGLYSH